MAAKIKIAVSWAAACGGCDVALLDSEERLLELAGLADIVYWPVAFDYKRSDLEAFGPGEIDIGIFNGAVRTTEHEQDAQLLRSRCKVLVAFGACAAFGGIPGLANQASLADLLDTVYGTTASTDNPDGIRPQASTALPGHDLSLPVLRPRVKALPQVVAADYLVPGCPPPPATVGQVLDLVAAYANGEQLPPPGTVLASDRALCDECPRNANRSGGRLSAMQRPHQVSADPERCFLDQGLLCLGITTRGGCGGTCLDVNMPCRGCFGPTAELLDPGAEALSTLGSMLAFEHEDGLPPPRRLAPIRTLVDLVGSFYRFTLPTAILPGLVDDRPQGE